MKTTKKILAMLLCVAMLISGAMLTAFASGEEDVNASTPADSVISSKTFDYASLDGITNNGKLSITPNGYLSTGSSSTKWHRVLIADAETMGTIDDYSVQVTFRWAGHDSSENCAVYFGTYSCDYSVKYNGAVQNFSTANGTPNWNNNLGKSIKALWAIEEGESYSPWITATLTIEDYAPKSVTFEVGENVMTLEYNGNVKDVTTTNKDGTEAAENAAENLYTGAYTGGNLNYHEISDYRVVAADGTIIAGESFAGGDMSESQVFISDAPDASAKATVSTSTGYLVPASSGWHKVGMLTADDMKDNGGNDITTYSVQQTFRWTANMESDSAIYFGVYHSDFNLKYSGVVQNFSSTNKGDATIPQEIVDAWTVPEGAAHSEWVTATLVISNSAPVKFIIKVGDKSCEIPYEAAKVTDVRTQTKSGQAKSTEAVSAIYTGGNTKTVEIYDFRVLNGVVAEGGNVPTQRIPKSTDVIEVLGVQENLNENAIRIVAKLNDMSIEGVTFEIGVSATNGEGTVQGKTLVAAPVSVGYTHINEEKNGEVNAIYAGEDSLFVLFVIRDVDFTEFDSYTFNIRAVADAYCSNLKTSTVSK